MSRIGPGEGSKTYIFGVHGKIRFLGWVHEKAIYMEGNSPKREALIVCRFKGGLGKK